MGKCEETAKYRFTWPGRDEAVICEDHVGKLQAVAKAIGLSLQVIPLREYDLSLGLICEQK